MTKDDYKAKIREAIRFGYEIGSTDLLTDINDCMDLDKLVDKFLAEKDD